MKTLTQEQFKSAVEVISKQVPVDYNSSKALMYGVVFDENDQITFNKISENGDVYEMLNPFNVVWKMKGYDFFTIVTCGWAAPIKDDISEDEQVAPSLHPEKRRVMLTVNATTDSKIGSIITFQDDPDNQVFDYGDARGSLAEAVLELISCYNEDQK